MKYKFLGKVKDINQEYSGIEIISDEGKLKVIVLAPDLIRVIFTQEEEFDKDFSYAIEKIDWNTTFNLSDNKSTIFIKTAKIVLEINKSPIRLTFKDLSGFVISQDEPSFGIGISGTELQVFKTISNSEKFFGLGEKIGNLDKRGMSFKMWNTDFFAYGTRQDPLYLSIPFFIGMRDHKAYGYFLDNSAETFFNMGASQDRYYSFGTKNGDLNYYFFYGPDVKSIMERYTDLTGKPYFPPIWALGYQQCRWSYNPDSNVLNLVKNFRHKKIPLDVVYLDIDWMDEFRVFQWNKEEFSNPEKLLYELKEEGVKTVTIIDPGIKADNNYFVAQEGLEGDHFVKYPDGVPYKGEVWPKWSYFPDFTNPETRKWWKKHLNDLNETGVSGFWNDMNEPAVWGQAFPDLIEFNYENLKKNHKFAHNIYGMQMARSAFESIFEKRKERPLIVTRAGYAGIQRYSAVWTGDNESEERYYLLNNVMLQNMALSGISFAGNDVGGFQGEPTKELFARWIQQGVFTPFFRTHSIKNSKSQEPWSFGEEVEENVRDYINIRYKLLPYIYSNMYESHKTGIPMIKPLFWFNQDDENTYKKEFQYQYYFGNALMVVGARSDQNYTKVYLPEGIWFELDTNKFYKGNIEIISESPWNRLPVFVRAGNVLISRDVQQFALEKPQDKLIADVYIGASSANIFYEDDGLSYEYLDDNYLTRIFNLNKSNLSIKHDKGIFESKVETWTINLHSIKNINTVFVNSKEIEFTKIEKNVISFDINETKEIKITWI
jgi:alpha-glucosidase